MKISTQEQTYKESVTAKKLKLINLFAFLSLLCKHKILFDT